MNRLKLTYKGNVILSNAFNMMAWRVMYDALSAGVTPINVDIATTTGMVAMFDGTMITADVITGWRELNSEELRQARDAIIDWYMDVKPHNAEIIGDVPERPILSLYHSLLSNHLPSEIDKQDPQLLFDVAYAKPTKTVKADNIPEAYKILYGR